jgi:ribonucleotide reductase alpha subunit
MNSVERWLDQALKRTGAEDLDTTWISSHFENVAEPSTPKEILDLATEASEIAIGKITTDSRWDALAASVVVFGLHEATPNTYVECVTALFKHVDDEGKPYPRVTHDVNRLSFMDTGVMIENTLKPERDFMSYQGIRMLLATYLLRDTTHNVPLETPQYLYMRMACGLYPDCIEQALEVYDYLSTGKISHATPWMYNLGTPNADIGSCYLYNSGVNDGDRDSISGFYETLKTTALIAKNGGGSGINFHEVRAEGTLIKGCGGRAVSIVKLLQQFNTLTNYVDQGRRREAAIAGYLEPWHAEIENFLQLLLKTGDPEQRTHKLHTALWIPDIFMRRCMENGKWPLFCPKKCPGLNTCHGEEFDKLFLKYEQEGRANKVVEARKIFDMICVSLADSGEPYIMFKDTVNRCDNQNLGTIENSNLCVPWETELWTQEFGPIKIGLLVPDTKNVTYEEEQHKRFNLKIEQLQKEIPKCHEDNDPKVAEIEMRIGELEMAKEALPIEKRVTEATKVHVFTGETWVEVTPAKTGEDKNLIRIETSHGSRIDCTPEHKWVLEGGKMIEAKDLHVGDKLQYTRPPMHTPPNPEDITEKESFMLGAVYAYGLRMKGKTLHDNITLTLSAQVMQLRRSTIKEAALKMFDYDEVEMKKKHPEVDHKSFIIIEVPPKYSQMRTLFKASISNRMAWVAGYVVGSEGGHHFNCITCYSMLRPVVDMFRSTGENVKMIPVSRRGHYLLCPVAMDKEGDERDIPIVSLKQLLNVKESVYCVSSKHGKAVFNGQVTGNCAEIVEYNDVNNISVCVLGAIGVDCFVREDGSYDFEGLHAATKIAVRNCNAAIDIMHYEMEAMKRSNKSNRPVGVGVMGFHKMLQMMGLPFVDETGNKANYTARVQCAHMHETMYHAAIEATCELSDKYGPHPSFMNSMSSRGKLHFDLMKKTPDIPQMYKDWDVLRIRASKGRRNSLLLAMMPTSSTSLIRGTSEGRNPIQSNVFKSKIMSGEFPVVNMLLEPKLRKEGLWSDEMRRKILANKGSVKGLGLPKDIEHLFATAWEIPQSVIITFAADAQFYVDQSMSTNIHYEDPSLAQLQKVIVRAWEEELKTGMYYLRSRPAKDGININQSKTISYDEAPIMGCESGACAL